MRLLAMAVALTFGVLAAGNVAATPLDVDEQDEPNDLDWDGDNAGTLDVGLNTVSGSTDLFSSFDPESFEVTLPAGLTISSISIVVPYYTNAPSPPPCDVFPCVDLPSGISLYNGSNSGSEVFNGTGTFAVDPFSAASSPIGVSIAQGSNSGFLPGDIFLWEVQFAVVPEPGAAALVGLAWLAFLRRRRARG